MLLRDTASADVLKEKYNILYVDDEEINLRVFKSTFKKHYNVFTCASGKEALDLLQNQEINLIVTDQRMPEMNGTELLGQIVPSHPQILRMIMTGFSDLEVIISAVNNFGIHQYITKPWEYEELKQTFDNFLANDGDLQSTLSQMPTMQTVPPKTEAESLQKEEKQELEVTDSDDLKKFTEALVSNKADNLELLDKHFQGSFLLNYSDSCEGKENIFIYEFKKEDAVLGFTIGCDITGIRGTMIKANVAEFAKDILLSKKAFNPVEFFKDLSDAASAYLKILNMKGDEVNLQMMYKHVSKSNVWILTNTESHIYYKHDERNKLEVHSHLKSHNLTIYRLSTEVCDRFYLFSIDQEQSDSSFEQELRDKISSVQLNEPELRKIELQSFVDFSISNSSIDKFTLIEVEL